MPAVLFGSISTIADTSELQREAFNAAFAQHGLDWRWSRAAYLGMLERSGGSDRVAEYAREQGQDVDAAAIHATKSELFRRRLEGGGIAPRPGVVDTIREARAQGFEVALVTTTAKENVSSLVAALAPEVSAADFDLLVDASDVEAPKPDAAAYRFALASLGREPADCVAVEDNLGGVEAATAAGVAVAAFPNQNTAAHDFGRADHVVDHLAFAELRALIPGA